MTLGSHTSMHPSPSPCRNLTILGWQHKPPLAKCTSATMTGTSPPDATYRTHFLMVFMASRSIPTAERTCHSPPLWQNAPQMHPTYHGWNSPNLPSTRHTGTSSSDVCPHTFYEPDVYEMLAACRLDFHITLRACAMCT